MSDLVLASRPSAMGAIVISLGLLSLSVNAAVRELTVVSSQIIWGDGVDLDKIDCLTLNKKIGNHIFKIDHSDDPKTLEILRDKFPNKRISTDFDSCAYVLTFVVVVADTRAVK
ncbi:MAG: hypothetical protein K2Z80_32525 [Xanthobacteraceae bacterium]|nr:hypothetical protein [Xanthobacteraceae bacterium]